MNDLIDDGRPGSIYEEKREVSEKKVEGDRVNLDLLPEPIDVLRVGDIDGYDICPCAGNHVRNTEEIDEVKITELENKGKNSGSITSRLG